MRLALAALFLLLLLASRESATRISREQAIEIAIQQCKAGHVVLLSQAQNIRTVAPTLLIRRWVVEMDGELQVQFNPSTRDPTTGEMVRPTLPPPYRGTCTVTLDADTGAPISTSGRAR